MNFNMSNKKMFLNCHCMMEVQHIDRVFLSGEILHSPPKPHVCVRMRACILLVLNILIVYNLKLLFPHALSPSLSIYEC